MSGSAVSDPRDSDDELFARLEGRQQQAAPAAEDSELQRLLDKATGGLVPRWENAPEQNLPDGGCVCHPGGQRCHRDATEIVWIGCPHEHVARSGVCGFHAIELEAARFGFRCGRCHEATGQVVLAYFIRREPIRKAADVQREQLQ